jgi:hypothetical protein
VTSTVPADSAGLVAVQVVVEEQLTEVPGTVPKETVSVEKNPVPVMVTTVPPEVGPAVGLMAVTIGIVNVVVVTS